MSNAFVRKPSQRGDPGSPPPRRAPEQRDAARTAGDTRERILAATLALFNTHRERHVTTNHIAAEVGISPGNLYYHFRNKEQIVFELYLQIESHFLAALALPRGRALAIEDIATYLQALFDIFWRYRFFFHELPVLVERVAGVRERYAELVERVLALGRSIYEGFVREGIMEATPAQIERLVKNSWIVTVYWFTFLETRGRRDSLAPQDSREGILQLVSLFEPYLRPAARKFVDDAVWAPARLSRS